jgi:hypothetical protein
MLASAATISARTPAAVAGGGSTAQEQGMA